MSIPARPVFRRRPRFYRSLPVILLATTLLTGGVVPVVDAAPSRSSVVDTAAPQNVDWMSPDTAMSLDIGIDVLVPIAVPEPFSSVAPGITAGNGYYQLYWMVPGGSPTFLYIEGMAGGSFPAGSPADLNKELTVNASVQGWDAIHDIGLPAGSSVPIYDQVWWIANGVLYTVSSNNMTGSDTLTLANSLIVLQSPAEPVPSEPPYIPPTEPPYIPITEPTYNPDTESGLVVDETVFTEPETVAEPEVVDTGVVEAPAVEGPDVVDTVVVAEAPAVAAPEAEAAPDSAGSASGDQGAASVNETAANVEQPWSPNRFDTDVPSDGTNGPIPPVIGGDGTGGHYDTALPSIRIRP